MSRTEARVQQMGRKPGKRVLRQVHQKALAAA